MQVRPGHDRRPLLIAAVFALSLVAGLGAWPTVHGQLCPSILIASSNEKYELMRDLAKDYSGTHRGPWSGCGPAVTVERVASGDAERLLAQGWIGEGRPDVWSPAASTWVELLRYHRPGIVPSGQAAVIARSPLVIAMPERMARAMSWPGVQPGWKELLQLANDTRGWGRFGHPEWEAFRLGKTDPRKSTSGLHSLIAAYYAATGNLSTLTEKDLAATDTVKFVKGVESSVSHYAPTVASFLDNMAEAANVSDASALSYISALAVEEQEVYHYNWGGHNDSVSPRIYLAAIYPNSGTLVADHPYVPLPMGDGKARIATEFLKWLQEDSQQERFGVAGFRNHRGIAGERLAHTPGILAAQPISYLVPPSPRVISAIQESWPEVRKPARVLILLTLTDKSQRAAIAAGVAELSRRDQVAIWTVEPGRSSPTVGITSLESARRAIDDAIGSARVVSGRLPLYLNIQGAYRFLNRNFDPTRINAIVIIAANGDDGSGPTLTDLEQEILAGSAKTPIRIYTVGLAGSDRKALQGIEKVSGGVDTPTDDPVAAIRASFANF